MLAGGGPAGDVPHQQFPDRGGGAGSYPLKAYLDQGIPVTLNTDNTTVSGTTLAGEYALARERLGMTEADERTAAGKRGAGGVPPGSRKGGTAGPDAGQTDVFS